MKLNEGWRAPKVCRILMVTGGDFATPAVCILGSAPYELWSPNTLDNACSEHTRSYVETLYHIHQWLARNTVLSMQDCSALVLSQAKNDHI